jgi:uncharacterized membrane protein YeiB
MKHLENFGDLFSIIFGAGAAVLKALKLKLSWRSILLSMCVAGVMAYGTIGVLALFFDKMSPKILVLASFSIGWVANELTSKLDSFVNDFYDVIIATVKSKFKK